MQRITLVIPFYNERDAVAGNLPAILEVVDGCTSFSFQVILVDDGSTDGTLELLEQFCAERRDVELLRLNRNFGKEAAILAGLEHSRGDGVIVMDSDLQHPPAMIPQMLSLWSEGIDVVEACKSSRGRESLASRLLAGGFYRLFNLLSGMDLADHSDFKLLDRKVVDAYCSLPERRRFFRGLVSWMGFNTARLYFEVPERRRGTSAWSGLRLLKFSISAMIGFSSIPLQLTTLLGVLCFALSLAVGAKALYDKFTGVAVSGFATVILLVLILGSFIMIALGLIGFYLDQLFEEIKGRPVYLLDPRRSRIRPQGPEPGP
jgi:dolichol-phosphate mannosyltransferase